jgi:hypothetical protein
MRAVVSAIRRQWMGALALFLVLAGGGAYAAFDPVGGDGDIDACFERRSGDLDLMKGKRCNRGERPVAWSVEGQRGPQGEVGPRGEAGPIGLQGVPGDTGPAGSPAASMMTGFVPAAKMPVANGDDNYFVPVGEAGTEDEAGITPNAPVTIRDLSVRVASAPGLNASWELYLGYGTNTIGCTIAGSFATSCNSMSQTATLPAGSQIEFEVYNGPDTSAAAPSLLQYGYRVVTP